MDMGDILDYLYQLMGEDNVDSKFVIGYVKRLKENYNLKYSGIRLTFEFMYKILGRCYGKLFPKYEEFIMLYNKASKYYEALWTICDVVEDITNTKIDVDYGIDNYRDLVVTFSKIK